MWQDHRYNLNYRKRYSPNDRTDHAHVHKRSRNDNNHVHHYPHNKSTETQEEKIKSANIFLIKDNMSLLKFQQELTEENKKLRSNSDEKDKEIEILKQEIKVHLEEITRKDRIITETARIKDERSLLCQKLDANMELLNQEKNEIEKKALELKKKTEEDEVKNDVIKKLKEENEMLKLQYENFEKELTEGMKKKNKQLKKSYKNKLSKLEKCNTDLRMSISLIQKEIVKMDGLSQTMSATTTENEVEIYPNSGVFLTECDWKIADSSKSASEFVKKLLEYLFDKSELKMCSFKGMGIEIAGQPPRPALDQKKVEALISCVLHKFPSYTASEITRTANSKMTTLRTKKKSP